MLKAIRKDGTPFQLFPRISKEKLREEKEKGEFYCPECKEKVMMRVGMHRREHFAHQKGSLCVESYERESSYHLLGKLQLFYWLETQKLDPKLEPFYDNVRQRPDIGFSYIGKKYALEFQCSQIPPELFIKRTKCYQKKGFTPIWIMGGKNIKRKGKMKVSLSNFDYLFASKSPSGSWYLPAYCSSSKIFILLNNLLPVSTRNALAYITIIPAQQMTVQKLLESTVKSSWYSETWRREIQVQKSSYHLKGYHQSELLRELYQLSLNISLLPPIIGLPVQNAPAIESSPLVWQAYLFMDMIYDKNEGEILTFSDVYRSFMRRVEKEQIKLRILPLVTNINYIAPLAEYLHLLVRLHVLEALNTNTFRIIERVKIPEHFVLQQELEDHFYKEYSAFLFG